MTYLVTKAEGLIADCNKVIQSKMHDLKHIRMVDITFDRLWRAEQWNILREQLRQRREYKEAIRALKRTEND